MEVVEAENVEASTSNNNSWPKLGYCEVCAFHVGKYTCPRCEVKTCSLRCNKIHKLELECNGERDRTKFVPLQKFSNLDLSSDYRLLEEITKSVEVSRKKFGNTRKFNLPLNLLRLKNGATARKTILKLLPDEFVRHKKNTTYFDHKNNTIFWHIDWNFVNAENLKFSDKKVCENEKIGSILNRYLVRQEDAVVQEKMQFYQSAGFNGIKILLKAEQKSGKKFYEVDASTPIKEILRNKIIIENPIFHVVLKEHIDLFDTIDTDDEEFKMDVEQQLKSGAQVVDDIIKKAESNDSLYDSLKNLLFVSEYSDDDGGN